MRGGFRGAPILAGILLAAAACSGGGGRSAAAGSVEADSTARGAPGTPVRVADVTRGDLHVRLEVPGRTEVLSEARLRAPFAGTLTRLDALDGDRVAAGQVVGEIVARASESALEGARAMLASASSPADSADARRALELAHLGRVSREIRAPADGVVLSHDAGPGDQLSEGDGILRLAATGSTVFLAQVPQSEAGAVRPGQPATVRLSARPGALAGVVDEVLPAASAEAFSVPVRIRLRDAGPDPSTGLFGTATITTRVVRGVLSVPAEAVLTDDVSGTSRVALAGPGDTARWVEVETGVRDGGRVQVSGEGLRAGDRAIVSGQVGLPGGAAVRVVP